MDQSHNESQAGKSHVRSSLIRSKQDLKDFTTYSVEPIVLFIVPESGSKCCFAQNVRLTLRRSRPLAACRHFFTATNGLDLWEGRQPDPLFSHPHLSPIIEAGPQVHTAHEPVTATLNGLLTVARRKHPRSGQLLL